MPPADLSRLESLAREATPGEWEAWDEPSEGAPTVARCNDNGCREIAYITEHPHLPDPRKDASANAAYIAAANPAAVLALIARVRELEGDAARFRHIIAGAEHFPDPEPRPGSPISWGWSIQWGCWTHQGADIREAIDAAMTEGG